MWRASSSKWQWQCGNMATRPWTPHIWANFLYSAVSSDMISCLAREASRVVPSMLKDDFSKRDSNSTLDKRPSDIPPLAEFISHIVVHSSPYANDHPCLSCSTQIQNSTHGIKSILYRSQDIPSLSHSFFEICQWPQPEEQEMGCLLTNGKIQSRYKRG